MNLIPYIREGDEDYPLGWTQSSEIHRSECPACSFRLGKLAYQEQCRKDHAEHHRAKIKQWHSIRLMDLTCFFGADGQRKKKIQD